MRIKYKKYQSGGSLPAKSGRLSKQERKRLRELRRNQKAQGFKRKSSTGLTSAEAVEKQRLERRRRENVGQDIKKGAITAGALGAAALAAPAVIGALGGGAGAAGAGAAGAGAAGTGTATTGKALLAKGASLIQKGSKAADVIKKAKTIADTAGKFVPKSLQQPEQAEQPESIMDTASSVDFNRGMEGASSPADPVSFMTDMQVIGDLDYNKNPDSARTVGGGKAGNLLSALGDTGLQQGRVTDSPTPLQSIMASPISQDPKAAPEALQAIAASPIAQNIVKADPLAAGKALKDFAGRAGLSALFAEGGKVGDPKKKEAMKLISMNEADYDNNLGDFYNAGEMAKADSVLQTMNNRYKRIVELGYKDEALDSLPYSKLTSLKAYEQLVKEQEAEDKRYQNK